MTRLSVKALSGFLLLGVLFPLGCKSPKQKIRERPPSWASRKKPSRLEREPSHYAVEKETPVKTIVKKPTGKPTKKIEPIPEIVQPSPGEIVQTSLKEEVENVATVQDSSKYAHAEDYSWLKGQLQHFGGRWSLRYATLDQSDKYGGSVKLEEDPRLRQYKDRQFVHVKGFLDIRASRGGPVVYRMYTIEPHK